MQTRFYRVMNIESEMKINACKKTKNKHNASCVVLSEKRNKQTKKKEKKIYPKMVQNMLASIYNRNAFKFSVKLQINQINHILRKCPD